MAKKIIPLNRRKLWIGVLGCIGFSIAGLLLLWIGYKPGRYRDYGEFGHYVMCWFGIVFGMLGAALMFPLLNSPSKRLVISQDGFSDQVSLSSLGFVPWSHVEKLSEYKIYKALWIRVHIDLDDDMLTSTSNWKRWAYAMNKKTIGAPIVISANLLQTTHRELLATLQEYLNEYRATQSSRN